jgi:hypothetical protein
VFHSDEEALALVASSRGAVALISADTPGIRSVRVLSIDGRLPGATGYPLTE